MKRPSDPVKKSKARETAESRRERLAFIKAAVEAGTYRLDPKEVSRKIIEAHLTKKTGS